VNNSTLLFLNIALSDYIQNISAENLLDKYGFKYLDEDEFTISTCNIGNNAELNVFHLNIRSLNSNHRKLCLTLDFLDFVFDVIVLTEIWTVNIDFYSNLIPGYNCFCDLPDHIKVGGVGLYIKNTFTTKELLQYKIKSTRTSMVENKWYELTKGNKNFLLVAFTGTQMV
jgi:hypothetical protein